MHWIIENLHILNDYYLKKSFFIASKLVIGYYTLNNNALSQGSSNLAQDLASVWFKFFTFFNL